MSTACGGDDYVVVEGVLTVLAVHEDNVASQESSVNIRETVSYADVTHQGTEDTHVPVAYVPNVENDVSKSFSDRLFPSIWLCPRARGFRSPWEKLS